MGFMQLGLGHLLGLGKKPMLLAGGGPRLTGGPALCSLPPPTRPGLQGLTELGG